MVVDQVGVSDETLDRLVVEAHGSREVFQAVGQWIGGQLASAGFVWIKSRKCWERRSGARRDQITLASSYNNRVGVYIGVWPEFLQVMDGVLGAWRGSNPELTFVRPASVHDIACANSYIDLARGHSRVDLEKPTARLERLAFAVNLLREIAVPWFAGTEDPARLAETVSDRLLASFAVDLVEFAMSHGQLEQARQLVARAVALDSPMHSEFDLGQSMARRNERPRWHTKSALGWSSVVLGLV